MADDVRRFHIQQCLGSGGFGEVYLARMSSPGGVESDVALKVLHEGLDPRSQAVQRLRDEGRLLGQLNHPAVLKARDIVMIGDRVALVMEYVPGLDLEGCFESTPPISIRAGVEVCARVADALRSAYETVGSDGTPLHLVHRDIKPSNIRVGRHGDVKLLDFGIAKASDARREAKTQTRVTIGSPWYMAPERFDRISDDPASDVYALGCTLYEVASGGKRLFEELGAREHFLLSVDPGRHDAWLSEHLEPLGLEPPVRQMIERMMAFERTERPPTHDLGAQLEDLAESISGTSLRKWVREVQWPEPPSEDGALVGRVLTEHRLSMILTPTSADDVSEERPLGGLEGKAVTARVPDRAPAGNAVAPGDLPPPDDNSTTLLDEPTSERPRLPGPVPLEPQPPRIRVGRSRGNPIGFALAFLAAAAVVVLLGLTFIGAYTLFTLVVVGSIVDAEEGAESEMELDSPP